MTTWTTRRGGCENQENLDVALAWLDAHVAFLQDPGNPLMVDHMPACPQFPRHAAVSVARQFILDIANVVDQPFIAQAGGHGRRPIVVRAAGQVDHFAPRLTEQAAGR